MRLAVSTIALPQFGHARELAALPELGFEAVEVAPSRQWRDTWHRLTPAAVADYRRQIEGAGLTCVGLHSLFFDHPELGLFKDPDGREATLTFLEHLSQVCRDLGGTTLIWGGGRKRGDVAPADAVVESVGFLSDYAARTADHGTCLCFEPLGPADSDFINSIHESIAIARAVDHPAVRVQVDAKAMVQNAEMTAADFEAAAPLLVHAHTNEPDLGVLGTSGAVDHRLYGDLLRGIGYDGFVSLEQKTVDPSDTFGPLRRSAAMMKDAYA